MTTTFWQFDDPGLRSWLVFSYSQYLCCNQSSPPWDGDNMASLLLPSQPSRKEQGGLQAAESGKLAHAFNLGLYRR